MSTPHKHFGFPAGDFPNRFSTDGFEDTPGLEKPYIHETAYIDDPCQIGYGTAILHFSHIMTGSMIGANCHIGHNVTIGAGVMIGNQVRVMNNALLPSGVIVEDNVYCGPSTVFTPMKNMRASANTDTPKVNPSLIRKGAHIGPNTTIAAGFTIGQHAFIEAGSVVDNHVPNFALVAGNPLTIIGWRCACGEMLDFDRPRIVHLAGSRLTDDSVTCDACGNGFVREHENKVVLKSPKAAS